MAFAGLDSLQTLHGIQLSNDNIREDFLLRTHVLERIRTAVYLSGTYVRDYLLEPESGKAEGHRYSLAETRKDMDAALAEYRGLVTKEEAQPFQLLTDQLNEYWKVLEPVMHWTPAQRQRGGFPFLRDEVFPRRMAMLGIANQIRAIDESQLNAGKVRMDGTFAAIRQRLSITIALTIALGLVLAAFSMHRILALETEATASRAQLQQLSARLVAAQEDERRSISRELHDEVGQSLTGVLVEMANLSTLTRSGDLGRVSEKAGEIKRLLEDSIRVVRNMALLLRPSMLDDLGLVPALEWQARETAKRSGIWIKVDAGNVSDHLPEEHKTCVYRIVQEALHNIVQHSGAHQVNVEVQQENDCLLLAIRDDGKGFDARRQRGMGLLGIEERVAYLGGTFSVGSHPGQGTVLRVTLPLAGLAAA
jgi:signal transduction histidine kinase